MKSTFLKLSVVLLMSSTCLPTSAEQPMSPEAKVISAIAVGGLSGFIFGTVFNKSNKMGGVVGVAGMLLAAHHLQNSRKDAVEKAFGPEYVGISALAAVGAAIATIK